MNRDFKGIWIPKDIWLNKLLTMQEKIFLVEIDSLDNKDGCFAGNAHFAEFFGISKTRVSLVIKSLVEKGFIKNTLIYKDGTKEILKRVLNVCYIPYVTKVKESPQQMLNTPIQQKLIDSNTGFSNTSNNTKKERTPLPQKFIQPTIEQVSTYMTERNITNPHSESEAFVDHYISNGWMVGGRTKMKDWKASVRNWGRKSFGSSNAKPEANITERNGRRIKWAN